MTTIVVDDAVPYADEAFGIHGRLVALPGRTIDRAAVRDADVLVTRSVTRVDAALVEGTRLSLVATASAGTDHVDVEALRRRGIAFASAAGCNAMAVAQYVLAAIALARLRAPDPGAVSGLARRIGGGDGDPGAVAVIGFGHVGRRLTRLLRACGITVRVCDPPLAIRRADPTPIDADPGYDADARTEPLLPWPAVLDGAAAVTLHVPKDAGGDHPTVHLLDASALSRLAAGAVVLNTCRGGVVDDTALLSWLAAGRGHAILDVFESEPACDAAVSAAALVTPHIAGYTLEGKLAATHLAADAVAHHLGAAPDDVVPTAPPPNRTAWTPAAHLPAQPPLSIGAGPEAVLELLAARSELVTDDAALRAVLRQPLPARAAAFETLRRTYRMRREHATQRIATADPATARHLAALGFPTAAPSEVP